MDIFSELSDPQKLLPFLLDPAVANLPADIITAYLQSVTKVFSQWAIEQADNWDDSYLANLKQQVENIISGLVLFAKNSDVEVQERVSISFHPFCNAS
jgi:AP-3 complex subunit delta